MAPRFAVLTDSTADLPIEIAERLGIHVVPLSVTIEGETLTDGVLTQDEFFERMGKAAALPTTSQPPVGVFVEAYQKALECAEQVISIHISNRLSGTIESARQAAAQFGDRVHVFDSLNLSGGLALQVMDAARAAAEGLHIPEAMERLKRARERTSLLIGLDSLENLAKGGRIGKVSAFLGSVLDLKVTLNVDDEGVFQPFRRDRGEKAALRHTLEWVAECMGTATRGSFAVGYALQRERAEWLREQIESRFDVDELYVYPAGSVICTHTGTGWGVTVLPHE